MHIVSGTSNKALAHQVAQELHETEVAVLSEQFPNTERRVTVQADLSGQTVALIQSLSAPVDEHIVEYLLLCDALEQAGANHVIAVLPWLGYSLQDKVFQPGEALSARVIAGLISHSGAERALLLDLHNNSIPGFFSLPTRLLSALDTFVDHAQSTFGTDSIIVGSPDFAGLKRAREFALQLDTDLINIDKQRNLKTGEVTVTSVHGDVAGKTVLLFDDCIVGGSTVTESAKILKESGATAVHFYVTHGLFVGDALEKIADSVVDSVIITDSVFHPHLPDKVQVVSIAPVIAKTLRQWE